MSPLAVVALVIGVFVYAAIWDAFWGLIFRPKG